MKNIHILGKNRYVYITSNEKIKDGDWHLEKDQMLNKFPSYLTDLSECKKIILTTDKDLIEDGIQSIDNEFLEWFIENSNCEHVQVQKILGCIDLDAVCDFGDKPCPNSPNCYKNSYKTIIPKEKPKQDFYKIGNFHEKCDDACKYHCTKGNTQLAECLKNQTAVEWLTEKLFSEFGFAFSNNILEEAKEMEKQQIIDAYNAGQQKEAKQAFWTKGAKYYDDTFENPREDNKCS